MKIQVKSLNLKREKADVLIVPIFKGIKHVPTELSGFKTLKAQVQLLIKEKVLLGNKNEINSLLVAADMPVNHVIFVGLGKKSNYSYNLLRNGFGNVSRKIRALKGKKAIVLMHDELYTKLAPPKMTQSIIEGLTLGGYEFLDYKTETKKEDHISIQTIIFSEKSRSRLYKLKKGIQKGQILGEAVNVARDFGNMPSNALTPTVFVDKVKAMFKGTDVKLEIIDKNKAKELGMGAFLGVAQGSVEPPYMVIMRYMPIKDEKPVCFVGKGVTFDAGGISIKPSKGMQDMKGDMAGAAAVIGAMYAVSQLKPQKNILAITPLTENMPSGSAQRPGDIVTAMNGKTVEVINTDAEGRLILADALCYAVKEGVSEIIDLATLTGAVLVALGDICSGMMGNNNAMMRKMEKVADFTGDLVWELPMHASFFDYLKSDVADMMNCVDNRMAGTVTAAKFLEQFVDKTPWMHLDIAGTGDSTKTKGYLVKGQSGAGVRNLIEYIS